MKIFRYILLLSFSCMFFSCSDFLEEDYRGKQVQKVFYNTDKEIEGGLFGLYASVLSAECITSNLLCRTEACSDLLTYKPVASVDATTFPKFMLTPESSVITKCWNSIYRNIFRINAYIYDVTESKSSKITKEFRENCLREAKFFRALMYYHAIMCWGDVPLRTEPTDMSDTNIKRTSKEKVWNQVLSDLSEAIMLPDKFKSSDGRVNKGVALTLLAKVYLALGNMNKAKEVLDKITGYSLMPNIKDVWSLSNKYNDESIWELNHEKGTLPKQDMDVLSYYLPMYSDFKGANATYPVNDYVLSMAEPNSERTLYFYSKKPLLSEVSGNYKGEYTYLKSSGEENTIVFTNATNPIFSHLMKFVDLSNNGPQLNVRDCPFNLIIYRYADVVLMRAEVECELNGTSDLALDLLNSIRLRARETPYSYTIEEGKKILHDKDELKEAIRNERALELIGEGHRFYDLKRWGNDYALEKLKASRQTHITNTEFCYNPEDILNISEEKLLWPIPESEMNANALMVQNPGYK